MMKMLSYFRRNALGHVDTRVEIDREYIIKTFNDTTILWANIGSINPIDVIQNVYGTFFIVKMGCGAGAECEGYYLIGYNTKNQPVSLEELGSVMADEDFLVTFNYRIVGDTAIIETTKNYEGSGKLEDSSVTRFPLKIQMDSLVRPQKSDSLIISKKMTVND